MYKLICGVQGMPLKIFFADKMSLEGNANGHGAPSLLLLRERTGNDKDQGGTNRSWLSACTFPEEDRSQVLYLVIRYVQVLYYSAAVSLPFRSHMTENQ